MINKSKLKSFIRTLSDDEITSQLADLFAFTEVYKQLLIEEQDVREYSSEPVSEYDSKPVHGISTDIKPNQNNQPVQFVESELDFNTLSAIQNKVAKFSVDELLDNMKELDTILTMGPSAMPSQAFEEYRVARETCEIRYFEDYSCEPILCGECGAYLLPGERYCRKCGVRLPETTGIN